MNELSQLKCEACRADAPQATPAQITAFLPQLPAWQIDTKSGIQQLSRTFTFPNFVEALAFTHKVGELAEHAGHHPALLTEWGKVTVTWWTHKIKGLHVNDFVMAAKTDKLI